MRGEKTRNGGTWTEAQYFSAVRSALRSKFRYWSIMQKALENASRPYKGPNKRLKTEYQCAHCKKYFPRKEVEIDHIIPCGSLKSYDDIEGFLKRLTTENVNDFQILCKPHHLLKTKAEKSLKTKTKK